MTRRHMLTSLASLAATPGSGDASDLEQSAIQLIQQQVDAGALESAVLRVQKGDRMIQHAFGKAADVNAIFLLASITKTLTATGVMVLADRGELRLSDPVMKFIPEFNEGDRKKITLEQLLTHTSGLPDQLADNAELRARHAPLDEFVQGAIRAPLLFAPGTKYHYQSMGILLAAEVMERITGKPFRDFLAEEIFDYLGMTHSALGLGSFKLEETVRCQTEHAASESGAGDPNAASWDWNSPYWRNLGAPWGGAHGSAADLGRFFHFFMHHSGNLLREETVKLMLENHTAGLEARRGLGFALGPAGFGKGCSEQSFGHSGSTGTLAWADPKNDTTCIVLTSLPSRVSEKTILKPVSDLVLANG